MMRVEGRTVKRVETERTLMCDCCGRVDEGDTRWSGRVPYRRDAAEIEARIGDVWPEGDSREVITSDICPDCMLRLFALLHSMGIPVWTRHAEFFDERERWETGRHRAARWRLPTLLRHRRARPRLRRCGCVSPVRGVRRDGRGARWLTFSERP